MIKIILLGVIFFVFLFVLPGFLAAMIEAPPSEELSLKELERFFEVKGWLRRVKVLCRIIGVIAGILFFALLYCYQHNYHLF